MSSGRARGLSKLQRREQAAHERAQLGSCERPVGSCEQLHAEAAHGGVLPEERRICIDEKNFTYGSANITELGLDSEAEPEIVLEPTEHLCEHPALPAITIPDPPPAP